MDRVKSPKRAVPGDAAEVMAKQTPVTLVPYYWSA
jgi:hypothetical protein